jgi:PKD repeat protein
VTAVPSYSPILLAEFTVHHAARNQMSLSLGISDLTSTTPTTTWLPSVLMNQGGAYAFNGTTTPVDGTFVLDFSDLAPSVSGSKRFYLSVKDSTTGSATTLKSFKLLDATGAGVALDAPVEATGDTSADDITIVSSDVPLTIDATSLSATVEHAFSDGNIAPVSSFIASLGSGYAPLDVQFDGTASSDADGWVSSYDWNFGDGTTASGAIVQHTYTQAGSFQAILTVTDNWGAMASSAATIVVSQDPNMKLHVSSIVMSKVVEKSGTTARTKVTVVDASGAPCSGATVTGQWSGVVSGSASGTTAADGAVSLNSPRTKKVGTFTFTVTGIVKSGFEYDPTANVVTKASIQ